MAVTSETLNPNSAVPLALRGKSTDTKPIDFFEGTPIYNMTSFFEVDTGNIFFFDAETQTWIES